MTRPWQDETVQIDRPDPGWWRENKPTLAEQALLARIRRDKAAAVAGWLWATVAAVVLVLLLATLIYAWHMGGPLNAGG